MSKIWRYYEGTTSANTVLKDISKVLCTAVKTNEIKDTDGNVVRDKEVILQRNWDIVYPKVNKQDPSIADIMDWNNLTPKEFVKKINNQLGQATDKIILKTKTTPRNVEGTSIIDDIGLENDLAIDSIDMYTELYKPNYLADSEVYHPECERHGLLPYLVTKDIYKEYAKKESEVFVNLKTTYAGNDSNKNVILSNIIDKGGNTAREQTRIRVNSVIAELKSKYNVWVNVPSDLWGSSGLGANFNESVVIPYEQFKLILAGSTDLSQIANFLYKPKSPDREYQITMRFSRNGLDKYETCSISIEWTRNIEEYTVNAGFECPIEYGTSIKWETVKVEFEDQSAGSNLMQNFELDKLNFKLVCKKTFKGITEIQGSPILSYTYKREDATIDAKKLLPNNHYIYARIFDKLNMEGNGPVENKVDDISGEIIQFNSKVSEWSKLSWYQDFEEVAIDSLDADPSQGNMSKGVVYLPLETPGLTGDTRFRFWINTNNDRVSLVLMGNPSLEFTNNRHLISAAYLGQIDSFDGSINDVAGNFALFTSSSTAPCDSKTISNKVVQDDIATVGVGDNNMTEYKYKLPNDKFFDTSAIHSIKIINQDSSETILINGEGYSLEVANDNKNVTVVVFNPPAMGATVQLIYSFYTIKNSTIKGIVRDSLGNVVKTSYPKTYGKNTATGVIDIAMLHTRSKAYYQKHHLMFTTTEEYFTKEMYGKSAYTGEYYADRLKITHGNDGPRGMLADMLAIDTSSLYAFDELIVNRNFEKDVKKEEETYVFFPVTAPFSPFSGSPNATFGLAVKKEFKSPVPTTDKEAIEQEIEVIELNVGNLDSLIEDIILPTELGNEVAVSWTSSDESLINFSSTSVKGKKGDK